PRPLETLGGLDGDGVLTAVHIGVGGLVVLLHGVEHRLRLLRRRRRVEVDESVAPPLHLEDRVVLLQCDDFERYRHASYPFSSSCRARSGPPLSTMRPSTRMCTRSGSSSSRMRW